MPPQTCSHRLISSAHQVDRSASMCFYSDIPYIFDRCEADPKHIVIHRIYRLCSQPQNVGSYRHCSDEYAVRLPDIVFGSSRVAESCPRCTDPKKNYIIVSRYLCSLCLSCTSFGCQYLSAKIRCTSERWRFWVIFSPPPSKPIPQLRKVWGGSVRCNMRVPSKWDRGIWLPNKDQNWGEKAYWGAIIESGWSGLD
jgi:hypothetical protein